MLFNQPTNSDRSADRRCSLFTSWAVAADQAWPAYVRAGESEQAATGDARTMSCVWREPEARCGPAL